MASDTFILDWKKIKPFSLPKEKIIANKLFKVRINNEKIKQRKINRR